MVSVVSETAETRYCPDCLFHQDEARLTLCPTHTRSYAERTTLSAEARVRLRANELTRIGKVDFEDLEQMLLMIVSDMRADDPRASQRPAANAAIKAVRELANIKKIQQGGDALAELAEIFGKAKD